MAFVYQAKRDLNFSRSGNLNLGPGAYIIQAEYKKERKAIPFNSSSVKNGPEKAKPVPGPGYYEVSKKSPIKADQFGRYKCTASFSSHQDRFDQGNIKFIPGPGSYDTTKPWLKKQSFKMTKKTRTLYNFPSVPSIPTQSQAFGYDETETGELICQKNPNKLYSGTFQDSVGPGHYNPKTVDDAYGSKGTSWHKSNSRRELIPSASSNIGPGTYNYAREQSIYKLKSSPAFASTCKRDSYIPNDSNDSYLYEEYEKDGNPGPGQYTSNLSTFSSAKGSSEYQKFGSGTRRFNAKANYVPGPGHYNTKDKPDIPKPDIKIPFASNIPRFDTRFNKTPGPGSYEDYQFPQNQIKKPSGKDEAFGTSEKRFIESYKDEVPGPGQYELENIIGIHNSATKKPLSVFASIVPKGVAINNSDNPPPGNYEIVQDLKKKKSSSIQPVLVRVNVGLNKIFGFNSQQERFKEKNNEIPGPGTYTRVYKNQEGRILGPGASTKPSTSKKNNKPRNLSKNERFSRKDEEFPGPGEYDDKKNYWSKKTFNIQFTDPN